MSSLSLAVPCACPAAACPFSPSLSVLLDSVSTSCGTAPAALARGSAQGRASPSALQGSLCPPRRVLLSSSRPSGLPRAPPGALGFARKWGGRPHTPNPGAQNRETRPPPNENQLRPPPRVTTTSHAPGTGAQLGTNVAQEQPGGARAPSAQPGAAAGPGPAHLRGGLRRQRVPPALQQHRPAHRPPDPFQFGRTGVVAVHPAHVAQPGGRGQGRVTPAALGDGAAGESRAGWGTAQTPP